MIQWSNFEVFLLAGLPVILVIIQFIILTCGIIDSMKKEPTKEVYEDIPFKKDVQIKILYLHDNQNTSCNTFVNKAFDDIKEYDVIFVTIQKNTEEHRSCLAKILNSMLFREKRRMRNLEKIMLNELNTKFPGKRYKKLQSGKSSDTCGFLFCSERIRPIFTLGNVIETQLTGLCNNDTKNSFVIMCSDFYYEKICFVSSYFDEMGIINKDQIIEKLLKTKAKIAGKKVQLKEFKDIVVTNNIINSYHNNYNYDEQKQEIVQQNGRQNDQKNGKEEEITKEKEGLEEKMILDNLLIKKSSLDVVIEIDGKTDNSDDDKGISFRGNKDGSKDGSKNGNNEYTLKFTDKKAVVEKLIFI